MRTIPVAPPSTWWRTARRRSARGGVGLLWVLGALLSYSALRELARMLGVPDPLAYAFPLVIDVAVWVGSMNALEARDLNREGVERYAWFLVALYAAATIAGNVVVGATETLDPRLVAALGTGLARLAAEFAGAAPAVTMILFSHLAGLLMEGRRPEPVPVVETGHDQVALAPPAVLDDQVLDDDEPVREQLPAPPAAAAADVREPAPATFTDTVQSPSTRPRAARRPRKPASKSTRAAREQAPRLSASDVRELVRAARDNVLAGADRPADRPLDDLVGEHLTAGGHPLSRSRVRTYLAELRRESAPQAPARRPRVVVNTEAAPAVASAIAQEA